MYYFNMHKAYTGDQILKQPPRNSREKSTIMVANKTNSKDSTGLHGMPQHADGYCHDATFL
jgi:hypothetical protein